MIFTHNAAVAFFHILIGVFKADGLPPEITVLFNLVSPRMLFATFLITLICYALINRSPDGGVLSRRLWENGRWLILLTAIVHVGLLPRTTVRIDTTGGFVVLVLIGLDIAAVVYVFTSKLVGDVFAEFPPPRDLE